MSKNKPTRGNRKRRTYCFTSNSPQDTKKLGRLIALILKPGHILLLKGELGSGKTLFVQGLAEGLRIMDHVTSPTFLISKIYRGKAGVSLNHIDLYRLDEASIPDLGMEEMLFDDHIVAVEWAEKLTALLKEVTDQSKLIALDFTVVGDRERKIVFEMDNAFFSLLKDLLSTKKSAPRKSLFKKISNG